MTLDFSEAVADTRPDRDLTRDQVVARNLAVVEAHFHNENPDDVDKAVALYTDDISWEAPSRGLVYTDPKEVLAAYHDIFKTIGYRKTTSLRRFATEEYVFDDMIGEVTVVGDKMPNVPYPVGSRLSVRLLHVFEMRDGRIAREIAYELWRKAGSKEDHDAIPPGAVVVEYPELGFPTA